MNGILPIYKEQNMTSHDVVFQLRKILGIKKIGHSGTLDPNATGVLLVLIGKATKILPFLEDIDKTYIATLTLGKKTFTDDQDGEILQEQGIIPIENFQLLANSFLGKQKQYPPMISSVKVNGKKLYEYARNNEPVQRPLKEIEIYDIKVLDEKQLKFEVHCSSGTYIRSLCVDMAAKSNNLGYMSSLIRTKVGRFSKENAVTIEEVKNGKIPLFSIYDALSHYPYIAYENMIDVYNGKRIRLTTNEDEVIIVEGKEVIALYKRENKDVFRCVRGLW